MKPKPIDYSKYQPGWNGAVFSPQGGLRTNMQDLSKYIILLSQSGVYKGKQILSKEAVQLMTKANWVFDGKNGDTLGGLIRAYGLGCHITTNTQKQDDVFPGLKMYGHTGSAYGWPSNMFITYGEQNMGLVFAVNGAGSYKTTPDSSFLYFEFRIQRAVYGLIKAAKNLRG